MIVADAEARGCVLLDAAEAFGDALSDWLECLVAGAVEGGVDADAFRRAMVDGDEDGDLAVLDGDRAVMSVPHMVSMVSVTIVPS